MQHFIVLDFNIFELNLKLIIINIKGEYMKIRIFLFLLICFSGCNFARKTESYLVNRFNDLTDIVSISLNANTYGAKAYAGPIGIGLHAEGLFSDCLQYNKCYKGNLSIPFVNGIPSFEFGIRNGIKPWLNDSSTIGFTSWELASPFESGLRSRNKKIKIGYKTKQFNFPRSQWTRFGFTAGFIFGARVEINPGEALDFFLGLIGLDFYRDDVYTFVYTIPDSIRKLMINDKVDEFKEFFEDKNLSGETYVDEYNNLFLHYAVRDRSLKIVKYLIETKKSNINSVSSYGWSPMGHLTWCSNTTIAEEKEDKLKGRTSCSEMFDYLEFIGASYIEPGFMREHDNDIIDSIKNDKTEIIEKYLNPIKRKSRFDKESKFCMNCVVFSHIEEIKALPSEGGEYNNDSYKFGGMTLLQVAIYFNKPNVVKYLLQKGSDPYKNNFRYTDSFWFANHFKRNEILEILQKYKK